MILVTGAAGFIGFHLSRRLLDKGHDVVGYDNVNEYYDPNLKEARLAVLHDLRNFPFSAMTFWMSSLWPKYLMIMNPAWWFIWLHRLALGIR